MGVKRKEENSLELFNSNQFASFLESIDLDTQESQFHQTALIGFELKSF